MIRHDHQYLAIAANSRLSICKRHESTTYQYQRRGNKGLEHHRDIFKSSRPAHAHLKPHFKVNSRFACGAIILDAPGKNR
ncbi:hypothetical protein [Pseudomonas sp. R1-1]|uniref:hypothetical protein n=1 Tax=Pseudomonas sp. R1-1 TaxID=1602529 RepID=UPI003DAA15C4